MRICLFADARSVHVQQLTKALRREEHIIHIVTHKPTDVSGATVERFTVPLPGIRSPHRWTRRRRDYLRGFVRSFDVVNIHYLSDWGFDPENGDWDDGCVVCSAWGSDIVNPPGEAPASPELRRVRMAMLRQARAVTTCGSAFAREVEAFADLDDEAISIVPFGVDCALFRTNRGTQRLPTVSRIGCYKGFRPVYGIPLLIRAMPYILSQSPDAHLVLVGEGSQLNECKRIAGELGLCDRITWLGRCPHDDLPAVLADWSISVMPSIHEAFGVAALESAAMELPVVASDAVGYYDTVRDGVTGVRVPVDDSRALASAIVNLLEDRNRAVAMGFAGRQWVQSVYGWDCVGKRWSQLFDRARERRLSMV